MGRRSRFYLSREERDRFCLPIASIAFFAYHVGMNDESLDVTVRVRMSRKERDKLTKWAKAYGDEKSGFMRRLLLSLPDNPPTIPQPPVKP